MIPAYLKQLNYMLERKSWAYVARVTDMPLSMLKSVVGGKKELTELYKNDVRNAFRREAYASLKDTGFSAREASRWSSYAVQSINIKSELLTLKIADLTTGALGNWVKTTDEIVTQRMINDKWDEIYNDIKRGISHSRLSTEDILDY